MKHYNIPIFIPHLGCPHDCIFCNQKKITGLENHMDISALKAHVDQYLDQINTSDQEKTVEIAFFGGSFTAIDKTLQVAYLELAYGYKQAGAVDGIRLSTRPDYVDGPTLDRLKAYGVDTIELGVQSLDDQVLDLSQRGYKSDLVYKASAAIKAKGFVLGLQMMLGLPGDSLEKSTMTAKEIVSMGPDFVRIYPTLVIDNTPLADLYKQGLYKALSLEEAVRWAKDVAYIFYGHDLKIIRLGLQDAEGLLTHCIAGPYHPSFKQLVASQMVLDTIEGALLAYDDLRELSFQTDQKHISELVGQKRSNLTYLEAKYKLKRIKVYPRPVGPGSMILVANGVSQKLSLYGSNHDKKEV